jgi:hypothetical protein
MPFHVHSWHLCKKFTVTPEINLRKQRKLTPTNVPPGLQLYDSLTYKHFALWFPINKRHKLSLADCAGHKTQFILFVRSHNCNLCTTVVLNIFSIRSFVAVHADNFVTPVSCERHQQYLLVVRWSLASISFNFSPVSTLHPNLGSVK